MESLFTKGVSEMNYNRKRILLLLFKITIIYSYFSEKVCNPKLLSCLHVFCESCLEKTLMNEAGDSGRCNSIIKCPNCKQDTKVIN